MRKSSLSVTPATPRMTGGSARMLRRSCFCQEQEASLCDGSGSYFEHWSRDVAALFLFRRKVSQRYLGILQDTVKPRVDRAGQGWTGWLLESRTPSSKTLPQLTSRIWCSSGSNRMCHISGRAPSGHQTAQISTLATSTYGAGLRLRPVPPVTAV